MKILLAEDNLEYGGAFRSGLTERGHEVVWITGITNLPDDPYGVVQCVDENNSAVEIRFSDFEAAFIDGMLLGEEINGWHITPVFIKLGIKFCAISDDEFTNRHILEGAAISCRKDHVLQHLDSLLKGLCCA